MRFCLINFVLASALMGTVAPVVGQEGSPKSDTAEAQVATVTASEPAVDSVAILRGELERLRQNARADREAARQSLEAKQTELLQRDTAIIALSAQNSRLELTVGGLRAQRDSLQTQKDTLRTQLVTALHAADSVALAAARHEQSLIASIEGLRINSSELERLLSDRERELRGTSTRLEAAERESRKTRGELIAIQSQTATLQKQLQQEEHEQSGLTARLTEQRSLNARLQAEVSNEQRRTNNLLGRLKSVNKALVVASTIFAVLIAVFLIVIGYGASQLRAGGLMTEQEEGEFKKTTDHLRRDAITSIAYYRRASVVFRQLMVASIAATGVLIGAVAVVLVLQGASAGEMVQSEAFWKAVATVGIPLAFVTSAYNVVESRRVELAQLLCSLRDQERTANLGDVPEPALAESPGLLAPSASK
jgi:hypothetical protein